MKTDYRKVWESKHGPIPKDPSGRTYEIHHIDGDHSNNSIDNLKLVTIQEHYDIHYSQQDYAACHVIGLRMALTPEEQFKLLSDIQRKRVLEGTHHFLDREKARTRAFDRIARGVHNFQGDNNPAVKKSKEGKHHWNGGDIVKQRMAAGRDPSQIIKTCEHCGTTCSLAPYSRWHGDRCRNRNK
jgi:hypothetical protein